MCGSLLVMKPTLAHERIKADLRQKIGGQWRAGMRLPPIKQLAGSLGYGNANTNRAVRDLVREGLLVSKPGYGTYVRDPDVHPGSNPWAASFDELARHVLPGKRIDVLRSSNEGMVVTAADAVLDRIGDHGAEVNSRVHPFSHTPDFSTDADAIVIINPHVGRPFTFPDRQIVMAISTAEEIRIIGTRRYDLLQPDSFQGAMLAGQRMRQKQISSACYVGVLMPGKQSLDRTSSLRLHGFEEGLGQAIKPARQLRVDNYDTISGARAVARYLKLQPRPQVVFTADDGLALGFIHGAHAAGLEPGRDYFIIGFDGQTRGREVLGGPLSTVDVPMVHMGHLAGELLISRLVEPDQPSRRILSACSFFEGSTTVGTPR